MIPANLDTALEYLYNRVPARYSKNQIIKEAFHNDHSVQIQEIILRLQNDGHIYTWVNGPDENSQQNAGESYGISIRGTSFFQNAKINKQPYHSSGMQDKTEHKEKEIEIKEPSRKRKWFWFRIRKK